MQLNYRRDIDGLRAIAVLSVVIFHLKLPLPGGFVGVDVFFTISGYLIGAIILRETLEGKFSFLAFYERRIRRIAPALFAMLAATSVVAYQYLLPSDLADYGRSLVACALSVSNLEFWHEAGYFDGSSATKPLLHTWSLAVEEQFYVFFPIIVYALHRYARGWTVRGIAILAGLSFMASVYGAHANPTATFYAPYTRAWELLIGTLVAPNVLRLNWLDRLSQVAGILGIGLIVGPMFLYNSATVFPGLMALPPCLGTALVIAASNKRYNWVSKVLSTRPFVAFGLISYSLYLWHWPITSFNDYGVTLVKGLDRHEGQAMMFIAAVALGTLSWRFIERPFRTKALLGNSTAIYTAALVSLLVFAALGTSGIVSSGWPSRYPDEARQFAAWSNQDPLDRTDQYRNGTCFVTSGSAQVKDFATSECLPDEPGKPSALLIGDSHAAAFWWGLNTVFPNINVMQMTANGCKPVLRQQPRQLAHCSDLMTYALKNYVATHVVDRLIIDAKWDPDDLPSLGETVVQLKKQGIKVLLIGPMAQYDAPLPRLLAYSILRKDPGLPSEHLINKYFDLDAKMKALAESDWGIDYFSDTDAICPSMHCVETVDGTVPLLSDYGHLTKHGSIFLASKLKQKGVLNLSSGRNTQ